MRHIHIVHCFDHNYVLPAAVCFYSLLEHGIAVDTIYNIHVVADDLTTADKDLLQRVVNGFPAGKLQFHAPPAMNWVQERMFKGSHFSKALLYKLVVPDLLHELDSVILSDVDVVYANDVAGLYGMVSGSSYYVAGPWDVGYAQWKRKGLFPTGEVGLQEYRTLFTEEERERMKVCAGIMLLNCAQLRKCGLVEKFIRFANENAKRLILPEQDIINLTCFPHVLTLPWHVMAYANFYDRYLVMSRDDRMSNPVWDQMYTNPIQIHYADRNKPWQYPALPMAGLWFDTCIRAGLFDEWRKWYGQYSRPMVTWAKRIALFEKVFKVFGRELHLSLYRKGREVPCEK